MDDKVDVGNKTTFGLGAAASDINLIFVEHYIWNSWITVLFSLRIGQGYGYKRTS